MSPRPFASHRFTRLAVAAAAFVGGLATAASPAAANTFTARIDLPPGSNYNIGVGHICANGSASNGYTQIYEYPTSLWGDHPILPNPVSIGAACQLSHVRVEIYSRAADREYDPWKGDGGAAMSLYGSANVGVVPIPRLPGDARLGGRLLSRSPINDKRVSVDVFQVDNLRASSGGVEVTAFSAGESRADRYTTGALWNGRYLAFITDRATGNKAVGLISVQGETTFDLDLDAICFGIDGCEWTGSVAPAAGGFHPLPPTRIADTRTGLGIPHGAVQPGDGRNADPDPDYRALSYQNHELRATGVGGVPVTGVSAVLLNVTVAGGGTGGSLKVFPKPPNTNVFGDQTSFGATPTSTQLYWRAGEDTANLVLAKVGVGGRLRIANVSYAPVDVIVDVVGWYDQGQAGQNGAGLVATPPERMLDSRLGIGGAASPFGPGVTRSVALAGKSRIPRTASSIVATVTGVGATSQTYVTVWPAGAAQPNASTLNSAPGTIRPNLATVAPGANGQWSLFNERGNHDLIVDVSGYYTGDGSGGKVTAIEATPVLDSIRAFRGGALQAGETRRLAVTGGPVPADAKAVLLNASVLDGTSWGYLTVYPAGQALPTVSNLNWNATDRRSNLVLSPLGEGGAVNLYNAFGQVQVAVEVVGWVR